MRVNALKLQYLCYCVTLRVTVLFYSMKRKRKYEESLKRRSKEEKEQLKLGRCGSLRYSNF